MSQAWPDADLDPIRRLRVLAAGVPGAVVVETVLPRRYADVWRLASDLEREAPRLVADVRWLRVTARDGERLEVLARGHSGLRARFDAVLRPGWCFMQSRFLVIGMAAAPAPGGTAFAQLAGLRIPGGRLLGSIAAPLIRRSMLKTSRRMQHDLQAG